MAAFSLILAAVLAAAGGAADPVPVSFEAADGVGVDADLYGTGAHWVVLVHGARFDKTSWEAQARALAEAGFSILAIDLRGYGRSGPRQGTELLHPGYPLDVLAAVRYARA
jgi:pimeloyl-ACP methyl ester carboxylesterase